MKKILLIATVLALLVIGSCHDDETQAVVRVHIENNFKQVGFIRVSIVPGFEHQYDTSILKVYKQNPFQQVAELTDPAGPMWGNVGISAGLYTFTVGVKNPAPDISYYMDFSGSLDSIDIQPGLNDVTVPVGTSQALILINTSMVDGAPLIQLANNKTGVMSTYGQYYYAYVKQGIQAAIRYTIDGEESMIAVYPYKEKIYQLTASQADVIITDPFTEVIQI